MTRVPFSSFRKDYPSLDDGVFCYLQKMLRTPDGIIVFLTSVICILVYAQPPVLKLGLSIIGSTRNISSVSYVALLIPVMQFVGYVWLNAFARVSQTGKYINAVLLISSFYLLINAAAQ